MKYLLRGRDPFSVVNHPWQPHVLAAHVLTGPVVVFAIGLITREHIVGRFLDGRPARGRASGIATILLAAPMIASGYLLQVTTDEAVRLGFVVAHVSSGLLFAILLVGHILAAPGRRGPRLDWRGERGIESDPRSESREPFAGPGGRPK